MTGFVIIYRTEYNMYFVKKIIPTEYTLRSATGFDFRSLVISYIRK